MDKTEYDRPEDTESKISKTLTFIGLAAVVVAVFYFGYYR